MNYFIYNSYSYIYLFIIYNILCPVFFTFEIVWGFLAFLKDPKKTQKITLLLKSITYNFYPYIYSFIIQFQYSLFYIFLKIPTNNFEDHKDENSRFDHISLFISTKTSFLGFFLARIFKKKGRTKESDKDNGSRGYNIGSKWRRIKGRRDIGEGVGGKTSRSRILSPPSNRVVVRVINGGNEKKKKKQSYETIAILPLRRGFSPLSPLLTFLRPTTYNFSRHSQINTAIHHHYHSSSSHTRLFRSKKRERLSIDVRG